MGRKMERKEIREMKERQGKRRVREGEIGVGSEVERSVGRVGR